MFCSEFKNKLYHGRLHNLVVNDSMYGSLVIYYMVGHTATHRQATYVGSYSMTIPYSIASFKNDAIYSLLLCHFVAIPYWVTVHY